MEKTPVMIGGRLFFSTSLASGGRDWGAHQMQFAAVQQFPLHLFARLQTDGDGQSEWKTDIEAGLLTLGTNRLHF